MSASGHLSALCDQGELTEDRLRIALLPLFTAYARHSAQLQMLRREEDGD